MRKLGALLIGLVAHASVVSSVRAQDPSSPPVALWVAGPGATEAHVAVAASTLTARGVRFVEHARVDAVARAALQDASAPPSATQSAGIAAAVGAEALVVAWLEPSAEGTVRVRVLTAPAGHVGEASVTPDEAGAALAALLGSALDAMRAGASAQPTARATPPAAPAVASAPPPAIAPPAIAPPAIAPTPGGGTRWRPNLGLLIAGAIVLPVVYVVGGVGLELFCAQDGDCIPGLTSLGWIPFVGGFLAAAAQGDSPEWQTIQYGIATASTILQVFGLVGIIIGAVGRRVPVGHGRRARVHLDLALTPDAGALTLSGRFE